MPKCPKHKIELVCLACQGETTSARKAKTSAANGRLGGRPKLPRHSRACDVGVTGRFTENCPRCIYDARQWPGKKATI